MKKPWMSAEDFAIVRSHMITRDWPERVVDTAYRADPAKSAVAQLDKAGKPSTGLVGIDIFAS